MPDRLSGIEVFVEAMRAGSLSAAARKLRMSPAMATKHLDALEQRLGVTLVRRTTRRLSLSEAGLQFVSEAERLLHDLAEVEASVSARTLAADGLLRVSAPVSFGVLHVAPLVAGFSREYPKVTIELGLNDRYVDLAEERWDVAVRIGRLADSSLIARRLASSHLVVCASPSYLNERGKPSTIAELKHHACLGYTLTPATGSETWSFGANGDIVVPVRSSLNANNGDALVAACIAGQGLLYGPYFIAAAALGDGRLVKIDLDAPVIDLGGVYAVTQPDRRPSLKVRSWIGYLAKEFSRQAF